MDTYEITKLAQEVAGKMFKNPELKNTMIKLIILNKPETLVENFNELITTGELPDKFDNPFNYLIKKQLWTPHKNGEDITVDNVINQKVVTEEEIIDYQVDHIEKYVNGIDNVKNLTEVTTNGEFRNSLEERVRAHDNKYYLITTKKPVTNEPYLETLNLWHHLPHDDLAAYTKVRNQLDKLKTVQVITHEINDETPMYNASEYLNEPLEKNKVLLVLTNTEGVTDGVTGDYSEQDCTKRNQIVISNFQTKLQQYKDDLEDKGLGASLGAIKNSIKAINQKKCNILENVINTAIEKEISTVKTNENSVLLTKKIKKELHDMAKISLINEPQLLPTINQEQILPFSDNEYSQPSTSTDTTLTTNANIEMNWDLHEATNTASPNLTTAEAPTTTEINWDLFEKSKGIPHTIATTSNTTFVETKVTNSSTYANEKVMQEEINNTLAQDETTSQPSTSSTQRTASYHP